MSNDSHIVVGMLTDPKDIYSEFQPMYEVNEQQFMRQQGEMPTNLAEAINLSIAFTDAVERDFGAHDVVLQVSPYEDKAGDTYANISLCNMGFPAPLSVKDSLTLAAYMHVAGMRPDLDLMSEISVASEILDGSTGAGDQRYVVTVTVNNDPTGDIKDLTQARLVVDFNSSADRWKIELKGSYDIDSDSYISIDGETTLDVRSDKSEADAPCDRTMVQTDR